MTAPRPVAVAVIVALAPLAGCGGGGGEDPSGDPVFRAAMDAVNVCQRQVGFGQKHAVRKLMRCVDHRVGRASRPDE